MKVRAKFCIDRNDRHIECYCSYFLFKKWEIGSFIILDQFYFATVMCFFRYNKHHEILLH